MRKISEGSKRYPESRKPLEAWLEEAKNASWYAPQDIKDRYPAASFLADSRVIFNIKGNKFRLITQADYRRQALNIIWFGSHGEYDRIEAGSVGK